MVGLVTMKNAQGLQALEILSEGFIDDLGVGEAVEVGLTSDGLNPALFDVEGGVAGVIGGKFAVSYN